MLPDREHIQPDLLGQHASSSRSRMRCSGLMPELRSAKVASPSSMTMSV